MKLQYFALFLNFDSIKFAVNILKYYTSLMNTNIHRLTTKYRIFSFEIGSILIVFNLR